MSTNPLKSYFRQPKIFLKLPSLGKYNEPASITGELENMPIYGMTGMDQIIIKTPDALLNGESTTAIIKSCCPNILDPWAVTSLDINSILVAIRIATFGNTYSISTNCPKCGTENNYDIDISNIISYYSNLKYNDTCVIDDLIIKLRPLSYKEMTSFGLETFVLQKQLIQISKIEDEKIKQENISKIYTELAILQNKVMVASIDYIQTPTVVVHEFGYVKEWIENCDQHIIETLKRQLDENSENWKIPSNTLVCDSCKHESEISIDLDYSSFFAKA